MDRFAGVLGQCKSNSVVRRKEEDRRQRSYMIVLSYLIDVDKQTFGKHSIALISSFGIYFVIQNSF